MVITWKFVGLFVVKFSLIMKLRPHGLRIENHYIAFSVDNVNFKWWYSSKLEGQIARCLLIYYVIYCVLNLKCVVLSSLNRWSIEISF